MNKYQIKLQKDEALYCDVCKKVKRGKPAPFRFTRWDEMKDGTLSFTRVVCGSCMEAGHE